MDTHFLQWELCLCLQKHTTEHPHCWWPLWMFPHIPLYLNIKGSVLCTIKRLWCTHLPKIYDKCGKNIKHMIVKRQMVVEGINDLVRLALHRAEADTGTHMQESAAKASGAKPGLESVRQAYWSRQRAESPLTPQLCASTASCLLRTASLPLDWNVIKCLLVSSSSVFFGFNVLFRIHVLLSALRTKFKVQ